MKKYLLIIACLISISLMAKDDYPNALMVELSNGSSIGFLLEGTTIQLLPSKNQLKITTAEENQEITLSEVKNITYEYCNPGTLSIGVISMNGISDIEIYDLEGRKLSVKNNTLKSVLNERPKGVYIVKINGQTLKIAK